MLKAYKQWDAKTTFFNWWFGFRWPIHQHYFLTKRMAWPWDRQRSWPSTRKAKSWDPATIRQLVLDLPMGVSINGVPHWRWTTGWFILANPRLDGFGWIWGIPHFRKPPWHIQPKIPVVVGWLLMVTVTYGRSSFSRGWSETCFIWWLEPSQRHDNLELWFCCNVATQRVFQKIMALMQPMKYDDVWLLLTYNLCRCSHVVITILPWLFHTAIVSFCRRSFNHWTNGSASARPQREQLQ